MFVRLRRIFLHFLFHLTVLIINLWVTGYCVAVITNQLSLVRFDFTCVLLAKTWMKWLIVNWSDLDWKMHNHLKIKLILSMFVPPIITSMVYKLHATKISSLKFFEKPEQVYGDAHWATPAEVRKANLRAKRGMLLGKDDEGFFVADGFQHTLLFAPTGSGKGVGFAIPNLLFWEDSIFVHDIKLENYLLTSGWRKQRGQEVFVWEPANPDGITHCYNPIDWISKKPGQMVDDVQKICNLLLPKQDFWENEARSLLMGIILYLVSNDTKPKTFGEVVRTLRSDDCAGTLATALDAYGAKMSPIGYMNISAFLQKADKERSGVVSTLNSSLELWANPLIDAATASSDFNILEMKKKRVTVYVGLTPDNIQRLQKLMQVFYQQATEFLTRKMPDLKEEPYGVMFLLDEFPTLGKMESFKAGIAYFRGYRVRLLLIIQDTQQLKGIYEEAGMNSFLSNSTFRVTFAANNYETANLISQLCGTKTVTNTSRSKGVGTMSLDTNKMSESISTVQRALLLPQEVIGLPQDEQIILIESFPPIKSKKIRYFQDGDFITKLLKATFVPKQEPYIPNAEVIEEDGPEDAGFFEESDGSSADGLNGEEVNPN
ncbi:Type IV secretion system protein VirD4 [Rickettsiales endosymbiont of Paramecium tredecaurelia]|uniref:type IV secretory system conjugative DNA transfer family protein n=1 Tax=Candidatus Sarmatiella mevalonica TaxID=2770581 RepID=UPI001923F35A|nr:type IV secretory system conjugative DNA transfer family protein [Candidatus Sarmatiella mevalonica]MBL3284909.1 Type IV secretion system protein VirD4 [Candidatus Sarmatiella mevalonica]